MGNKLDTPRLTDERLKSALNGNQPSRERMCLAILALDRNYSDIRPRRPEGGPDGSRDIECNKRGERCFGAVGFLNNACDSQRHKTAIRKKFKEDITSAKEAEPELKAFVFFSNIDLTPTEIEDIENIGRKVGFTSIDIYWRERLRQALDGVEGLAIRYQYLSIPLSEAEQATFFSRFGKDIEHLLRGRFDKLERKLDEIEFERWKAGNIRSLKLRIDFKKYEESRRISPEHFRVCLELQSVCQEQRSIIYGGRDDFWPDGKGNWYFGTKEFFWRQKVGKLEDSWVKQTVSVGGGIVLGIHLGVNWIPVSPILAAEFDHLFINFHFSHNLLDRISWVHFLIDEYLFLDWQFKPDKVGKLRPCLGWPDELSADEAAMEWRSIDLGGLYLDRLPEKKKDFS